MQHDHFTNTLSAQAFVRLEWTPGWSVFVRKAAIALASLGGLVWAGSAGRLVAILRQILS